MYRAVQSDSEATQAAAALRAGVRGKCGRIDFFIFRFLGAGGFFDELGVDVWLGRLESRGLEI